MPNICAGVSGSPLRRWGSERVARCVQRIMSLLSVFPFSEHERGVNQTATAIIVDAVQIAPGCAIFPPHLRTDVAPELIIS